MKIVHEIVGAWAVDVDLNGRGADPLRGTVNVKVARHDADGHLVSFDQFTFEGSLGFVRSLLQNAIDQIDRCIADAGRVGYLPKEPAGG